MEKIYEVFTSGTQRLHSIHLFVINRQYDRILSHGWIIYGCWLLGTIVGVKLTFRRQICPVPSLIL